MFGSKGDLSFYKDLALRSGSQALELGVETARVAIHLARAGVAVVGIDNSVHMLRDAKSKLTKEPEDVRRRLVLRKGDMRDFHLEQSFPFIYIPVSTFDHNVTAEDRRRTMDCVYKHLERNGTPAFDLEQVTRGQPGTSWWIDRKETADGRMVVRCGFTRKDVAERTCVLDLFFDVYKGGVLLERYHEYGTVAIISKDEITRLLEETGFRIDAVCGGFDKSKHQASSPRTVIVARKN